MEFGILLTPHPIIFEKNIDTKRMEYIFLLNIEITLPFSKWTIKKPPAIASGGSADVVSIIR